MVPRRQPHVILARPTPMRDASNIISFHRIYTGLAAKQGVWTDPRKRHNRTMPFSERNIFLAKGKILQRCMVLL